MTCDLAHNEYCLPNCLCLLSCFLLTIIVYTNIINTYKQKPHVVKALEVIEKEEMIKMLQELPNDLLSMVITQIDPDVFGDMLLKKHAGLLAEVVMM